MKRKEDLFHLIQAMSRTEKRYFTLDAQKSGRKGSKYLELFQAINKMEQYEEHTLRKQFSKTLPSDKTYLYEAIMRSMRDYHSSKSKAAQIKELIMDSKYLFERSLYDQCEIRLQEAKRLAEALGDQLACLEIIKAQRRLVWSKRKSNYENQIEQLLSDSEYSLASIHEEINYLGIYDQLSKEVIRRPDIDDKLQRQLLQDKYLSLISPKQLPENPHARHRYFQSAALYYQLLGDTEKVSEFYAKVVDWWDGYPKYKAEEFNRYVVDISNLLFICLRQKKYNQFPELIARIEKEPPTNFNDKKLVFQKLAIYKLVYFINSGKSEGVYKLVTEIEEGLNQFAINPGSRLILSGNVVILLFILQDYSKCLEWCDRIIRGKRIESRFDIQKGMHLLYIISLIELEKLDEVESALRMTKRFFQNRPDMNITNFESVVYSYLKKWFNAPINDHKKILQDLHDRIQSIKENPEEKVSFGLDDLLIHWLISKLESTSILDQIRNASS